MDPNGQNVPQGKAKVSQRQSTLKDKEPKKAKYPKWLSALKKKDPKGKRAQMSKKLSGVREKSPKCLKVQKGLNSDIVVHEK